MSHPLLRLPTPPAVNPPVNDPPVAPPTDPPAETQQDPPAEEQATDPSSAVEEPESTEEVTVESTEESQSVEPTSTEDTSVQPQVSSLGVQSTLASLDFDESNTNCSGNFAVSVNTDHEITVRVGAISNATNTLVGVTQEDVFTASATFTGNIGSGQISEEVRFVAFVVDGDIDERDQFTLSCSNVPEPTEPTVEPITDPTIQVTCLDDVATVSGSFDLRETYSSALLVPGSNSQIGDGVQVNSASFASGTFSYTRAVSAQITSVYAQIATTGAATVSSDVVQCTYSPGNEPPTIEITVFTCEAIEFVVHGNYTRDTIWVGVSTDESLGTNFGPGEVNYTGPEQSYTWTPDADFTGLYRLSVSEPSPKTYVADSAEVSGCNNAVETPTSTPDDLHCPDGGTKFGATGTETVDGVTVTWGDTSVTIEGGSATFCVKGGTSGNSGEITKGPGTYTTDELGLVGPQGQAQDISYLVIYGAEPDGETPVSTPATPDSTPDTGTPTQEPEEFKLTIEKVVCDEITFGNNSAECIGRDQSMDGQAIEFIVTYPDGQFTVGVVLSGGEGSAETGLPVGDVSICEVAPASVVGFYSESTIPFADADQLCGSFDSEVIEQNGGEFTVMFYNDLRGTPATPDSTPDSTPTDEPDNGTPTSTPDSTPDSTPVETPDSTPVETPVETPVSTPDETPASTPDDETPVSTPDVTPTEVVVPDEPTDGGDNDRQDQGTTSQSPGVDTMPVTGAGLNMLGQSDDVSPLIPAGMMVTAVVLAFIGAQRKWDLIGSLSVRK